MQKVFINVGIRKLIFYYFMCIAILIVFSIVIVGIGNKISNGEDTKEGVDKYNLGKENIVLKNDTGTPNIKIYLSSEDKIVEMNLEEYVRGVVCAEMPADFGLEALKAQAVAARTYAIAHMEQYGGTKCTSAKGADICDTVNSQAYVGKEERLKQWPASSALGYWNKVTDAVNQTEGKVLEYDGKLVMEPYYFAVSSGKTEDAAEVFSSGEPYLKSVSSVGDEEAKNYKTTKKITISQFVSSINSKFSKAAISASNIKSKVNILERTSAGSVKRIKMGGVVISGSDFRNIFDLNSANFKITVNSKDIQIDCFGYGHGVGMSQWGAGAMAKKGSSYEQILTHYYQGVKITKIENLFNINKPNMR